METRIALHVRDVDGQGIWIYVMGGLVLCFVVGGGNASDAFPQQLLTLTPGNVVLPRRVGFFVSLTATSAIAWCYPPAVATRF